MPDLTGGTLNNCYRVNTQLDHGGMAEVYQVWYQQRSVYRAMKVLREDLSEDRVFLRWLRREPQTLARLHYPHIVRFYSLEQEGDPAFMLMEYVDRTTLRKKSKRLAGALPLERVREVMCLICAALYYAHNSKWGIVHCDVKPATIMSHKNGNIVVAGFGIPHLTESATTIMAGVCSPACMIPEQVRGEELSPQTHICALGIVLYEMLTDRRPFIGEQAGINGITREKVRWEQLNLDPPFSKQYNLKTGAEVEAVALKCLEKEPEKQYRTMMELISVLEQAFNRATPRLAILAPPYTIEAKPRRKMLSLKATHGQADANAQPASKECLSTPIAITHQRRLVWLWMLGGLALPLGSVNRLASPKIEILAPTSTQIINPTERKSIDPPLLPATTAPPLTKTIIYLIASLTLNISGTSNLFASCPEVLFVIAFDASGNLFFSK